MTGMLKLTDGSAMAVPKYWSAPVIAGEIEGPAWNSSKLTSVLEIVSLLRGFVVLSFVTL